MAGTDPSVNLVPGKNFTTPPSVPGYFGVGVTPGSQQQVPITTGFDTPPSASDRVRLAAAQANGAAPAAPPAPNLQPGGAVSLPAAPATPAADTPPAVHDFLAQSDPAFNAFWARMTPGESGGKDVPNYRYDPTHTASGQAQITDTNWIAYAPKLGIDVKKYPTAMSAPPDYQKAVTKLMFRMYGTAPWDTAHGGSLPVGGGYPGNPAYIQQIRTAYDQKAADTAKGLAEITKQLSSDGPLEKAMDQIRKAREKADAAQDAAMDSLKHQPAKPVLDGVQHMTSLATIVGLLGGLFTKAPMTASLGAAAAAIEAYNAGDLRSFNIAHSLWKEQSDYLFKLADMNAQRVRDVISEEKLPIEERRAKVDVLLRALGLQQVADQSRIDGLKTVQEYLDAQEDLKLRREKADRDLDVWVQVRDKNTGEYSEVNLRKPWEVRKYPEGQEPANAKSSGASTDEEAEIRQRVEEFKTKYRAEHNGQDPGPGEVEHARYLARRAVQREGTQATRVNTGSLTGPQLTEFNRRHDKFIADNPDADGDAIQRADYQAYLDVTREVGAAKRAISGAAADENAYTDSYVAEKVAQLDHKPTTAEIAKLKIEGRAEAKNTMRGIGVISDEAATLMAQQMILGTANLSQLPRSGPSRIKVENKFAELLRDEPEAARAVVMNRLRMLEAEAAARTAGRVTMQTEMFAQEAQTAGAEVVRTSKLVPRGDSPIFNRALEAFYRQEGDPNIIAFGAALNALVNAYGKMSNPTGTGIHDADKERLQQVIDTTLSQGQIEAGVNQIIREGQIISGAAQGAQGRVLQGLAPTGIGPSTGAPPRTGPPPPPAGGGGGAAAPHPPVPAAIRAQENELDWSPTQRKFRNRRTGQIYDENGNPAQ